MPSPVGTGAPLQASEAGKGERWVLVRVPALRLGERGPVRAWVGFPAPLSVCVEMGFREPSFPEPEEEAPPRAPSWKGWLQRLIAGGESPFPGCKEGRVGNV